MPSFALLNQNTNSLFINFTKLFISNGFYYKYLFTILLILLILMISLL